MSATPGNDLPGAFPADTTTDTHDGHQRNKLHKRNDPRGWADNDSTPRTGTGSGIAGSHARDSSLNVPGENYTLGSSIDDKPSPASEQRSRFDTPDRIHNQGQPTSTEEVGNPTEDSVTTVKRDESSNEGGLASGDGTASTIGSDNRASAGHDETPTNDDHNVVRGGISNKSNADNSEPYWGDIPRGAGTYNTVVGHGSAEDSVEGHPPHREFPLSTGTHGHNTHDTVTGTSAGDTATHNSALTSGSPTAGQGTYNTVVGHGSREDPAKQSTVPGSAAATASDREPKDSHHKEIAAGAGAAGIAGYAANKHTSKEGETVDSSKRRSHEDKEHEHGGPFHHEHKHESSKHEKSSHEKDHKPEKTKSDSDKKFFGVFGRSKKDSDDREHSTATTAATREAQETSTTNPTTSGLRKENESHLGRDATLAGAGLAGAGYAGHKHATKDDEHDGKQHGQDTLRRKESPKDKSGSKLHGIFHRNNKDKETSSKRTTSTTPPDAAHYYNDKQPAHVVSELERRGKANPGESVPYGESTAGATTLQQSGTSQPGRSGAHDTLGYAGMGAAAAAIPATAHASHKQHEQYGNSPTSQPSSGHGSSQHNTLASGPAGVSAASHSSTQPTSSEYSGQDTRLSSGAAPGLGATTHSTSARDTTAAGRGDQYDHLSSGTPSGISAGVYDSSTARSQPASGARGDQYQHLSSGTPSGVSTGGHDTNTARSQPASGARGDQYDHLASGTPSGVSAGSYTHTTHSQRASSARGNQYDHLASGTPSGVSAGAPTSAAGTSSSAFAAEKQPGQDRNNLAYAGAGAAGAGAAAYGAHKVHEHHSSKTQPSTASSLSPNSSAQRPSGAGDRHTSVASNSPPGLGAGAPHSVYGPPKDQEHRLHGLDDSGANSRASALSRSSQDSSKGGQYNVLSSGTPSGINIGKTTSHSHPQQDNTQRSTAVHDPLTSSSQSTNPSRMAQAGAAAAFAGAGAAGYATTRDKDRSTSSAPTTTTTSTATGGRSYDDVIARAPERQAASGTGGNDVHGRNIMSGNERKIDTSTDPNAGSAAYDNKPSGPGQPSGAGSVFTGAAVGPGIARHLGNNNTTSGGSGLSKPVMHTCTECGKQNDISKYFSSDKEVARH
ncbi:uncharacterized protein B0I36DRAFT_160653 [Microdochium trichocladiopsis]|uniref:Uncharacterized protein n=1 Tax=Microdochium trichocladiopsis TaxID=1682393 RepID=A0A9P8Y0M5_9PEZI|nr:uncharacterized protein B0I36DRAFT_160653 [Microdochium trichocladiopsis]KAH7026614.1 hypothetical protein B0I36DRAFT_160653 [Microdochium trichocladiopsis]